MEKTANRRPFPVVSIAVLILSVLFGVPWLWHQHQEREARIRWEEMFSKLQSPDWKEKEGYWVGDVAELYRLGRISREVAEADTAPLNPLVAKPIPFHGYFVRALESGYPEDTEEWKPIPLKGLKRCSTFAICCYPEDPSSGLPAVIYCGSTLRRGDGKPPPGFQFPSKQERLTMWAIVD